MKRLFQCLAMPWSARFFAPRTVFVFDEAAETRRHNSIIADRHAHRVDEQMSNPRFLLSREAVAAAFADVTDPAGVVALIVSSTWHGLFTGCWRGYMSDDERNGITEVNGVLQLDPFDARWIMTIERQQAVDHHAFAFARSGHPDPLAQTHELREVFDLRRTKVEAKYSRLILALRNSIHLIPMPPGKATLPNTWI